MRVNFLLALVVATYTATCINMARMAQKWNSSVERDSAIEELVHNVELAKTNNAQTNMLGMSILEVLYATVEDEQEFEPF
ncbi:hypothetical protein PF005_g14218 [Phytophthora fragariae]|uniref:RxLR effector protein n=1 Tax=Phytophthora fragariae TaxID=53985 RepID=A0A6A3K6T5_9STRA|nr:hypothetical protein PF003_g16029 [Phytophthora fragariae]KAE8934924.1 hypothetical protein PF009_g15116 [Phytophthora fragariae]KAE9003216.1 hypothetical protein PF011_g12992 [Phytophthora fragariae]KAE9103255.1 hypothetical protein PF007_g14480 [Phytophthora fragariae]KAE9112960.1 hypothetical protein PF010_g10265 [Phytophthora fragariae]